MSHKVDRVDVELARLTDDIIFAIGRPVSAGIVEVDGERRLFVRDPSTGDEIDLDDTLIQEIIVAHDPTRVVETEAQRQEREVDDLLAPLVDKARSIKGGSTTVTFTAREMQTILAAVVLRPRGTR